jgi:anthranilate phosphoribosyltransferase
MAKGLIWNAGFYLWRQGSSPTLDAGLAKAEGLLRNGRCEALRQAMAGTSP